MWQKCPICDGSGNVLSGFGSLQTKICTVCDGKKIINELTGLPPKNIAILTPNPIKDKDPREKL